MSTLIRVGEVSDVSPGTAKLVEARGKRIALFNLNGQFYALDNTCTHEGGPLADGSIEGETVTCPWHGAVFNIKTGAVLYPPAPTDVHSYKVHVDGAEIKIELP